MSNPAIPTTPNNQLFPVWKALCYELLFISIGFFIAGWKRLGIVIGLLFYSSLAVCLLAYQPFIPDLVLIFSMFIVLTIRFTSPILLYLLLRNSDRSSAISRQWKCIFFTALIPGLGFLLNKRWLNAVLQFLLNMGIAIGLELILGHIFILSNVVLIALFTLNLYLAARNLGPEPHISARELRTFLVSFFIAYVLVMVLHFDGYKRSVAEFFIISGGSMRPTLVANERVISQKNAPTYQRWDVVVYEIFRADLGIKQTRIGRLVGMPGEKIEFLSPGLLINDQPPDGPTLEYVWPTEGLIGDALRDKPRVMWLTKTQVCILGDHSSTASDSRVNGPVNLDTILGKVTRVWWPPSAVRIVR